IPALDAAQITTGTFTTTQIPNLDAGKIVSGIVADARISAAMARTVDVNGLVNSTSNGLSTRLLGTNDALVALINSLSAQLSSQLSAQLASFNATVTALSNHTETNIFSSATFASRDPADSSLIARGLKNMASVAAPVWASSTAVGSPLPRSGHSGVWTGHEIIVWGGVLGTGYCSASGGWYQPELDTWTTVSTINAPTGRRNHSTV